MPSDTMCLRRCRGNIGQSRPVLSAKVMPDLNLEQVGDGRGRGSVC